MLNRFANLILLSSKHPGEAALTAKGVLIGAVPILIAIFGLAHVQVSSADLTTLIDTFFGIVQALLTLVSLTITLYGLLRKVARTWRGDNTAVNDPEVNV